MHDWLLFQVRRTTTDCDHWATGELMFSCWHSRSSVRQVTKTSPRRYAAGRLCHHHPSLMLLLQQRCIARCKCSAGAMHACPYEAYQCTHSLHTGSFTGNELSNSCSLFIGAVDSRAKTLCTFSPYHPCWNKTRSDLFSSFFLWNSSITVVVLQLFTTSLLNFLFLLVAVEERTFPPLWCPQCWISAMVMNSCFFVPSFDTQVWIVNIYTLQICEMTNNSLLTIQALLPLALCK